MSQDTDIIFKTLRVVPDFDGNPNVLTRFINICDKIVSSYLGTGPESELSNLYLLNGILNKITGPAASTINSNGIPNSWLGIRSALINNFSDQRDETALYSDLSLAAQGSKTPQEFYDHCQTLFSTIMTYVSLHETVASTVDAKRSLYKRVAMQAFVRGLKDPLGSRIRCMRPATIEKALEFVQEELNVMYLQQRHDQPKAQQLFRAPLPPVANTVLAPRPLYQVPVNNWPNPVGQRGFQPPPQPFKFSPPQQQGYAQQRMPNMPTRTQQMFRSAPPNYNPQSNLFRLQPRYNAPQTSAPKPMSGVQHFTPRPLPHTMMTGHDWRRAGNPPPNNYFKAREMHLNECATYDDDTYSQPQYDYDPYHYSDCDYNSYDYDSYAIENPQPTCYEDTGDDQLCLEGHPQPGPSHEDQDFRSTRKSKKSK